MTTNVPGRKLKVIGGRDHHLLELIANKMNFKFQYVDPRERTQGSSVGSERKSLFTGGLGMIQNRVTMGWTISPFHSSWYFSTSLGSPFSLWRRGTKLGEAKSC